MHCKEEKTNEVRCMEKYTERVAEVLTPQYVRSASAVQGS
jgi:hypothetical protein